MLFIKLLFFQKQIRENNQCEYQTVKNLKKESVQIDEEIGGGVIEGVDAICLRGLLEDGVYVADVDDGLKNTPLLEVEGVTLLLGFPHHLVVFLDKSTPQSFRWPLLPSHLPATPVSIDASPEVYLRTKALSKP